ncbi:MAG: polymorphic toxin type 37 domain-containing protein, partial [Erysipelotrichaceae bacterium]|nr:polymorphic toxin type 37 domain-containing protein [Erysipelotrichaceae bacterium]
SGTKNIQFEYNDQGLRTFKRVDTGQTLNSNKIYKDYEYVYDLDNKLICQRVTYLNSIDTMIFLYHDDYLYGFEYGQSKYFYLRDSLGNINGIIDSTGNLVVEYVYNAFGKIIDILGEMNDTIGVYNPMRYKGYYYDEETQLYWVSSRYYSPELCRWISPDSIKYLDPESINGLNLYCYCYNDPINYYDPSGHFAISTLIILGLIAVGAVIGGTVAGVNSYNNGNRGWELAGDILGGALIGGAIGGIVGYFAAPGIAAMLSSTGTIGGALAFAGGMGLTGAGIAISTVGQLALAGTIVSVGALSAAASTMMFYDGRWPGDNPTKAPDGFEWRGNGAPGSSKGNWYNPDTGEILHPDLNHPQPIGPHWDFRDILKQWWRIFRNGKFPK